MHVALSHPSKYYFFPPEIILHCAPNAWHRPRLFKPQWRLSCFVLSPFCLHNEDFVRCFFRVLLYKLIHTPYLCTPQGKTVFVCMSPHSCTISQTLRISIMLTQTNTHTQWVSFTRICAHIFTCFGFQTTNYVYLIPQLEVYTFNHIRKRIRANLCAL